ncbi:SHOCT domain-containing protein [Natrialbaceae archaeon A-CW3]
MTTDDLVRTIIVIVAILFLAPFVLMVLLWPAMGMGGGHMWNGGMWDGTGSWFWMGSWLFTVLVVGAIGYLLFSALRGSDGRETDSALEELRLAYARGDLTDEEFEQRRERLERDRG